MAFTSGFFNSKGLDRTYTAEDFTSYLSSIICNGILDTYGQMFRLTAASSGLKVTLGTGKAWIDGHYFINDARYSIDLTSYQDESLPRYEALEGTEHKLAALVFGLGFDAVEAGPPEAHRFVDGGGDIRHHRHHVALALNQGFDLLTEQGIFLNLFHTLLIHADYLMSHRSHGSHRFFIPSE